jgi:hypothetical protein
MTSDCAFTPTFRSAACAQFLTQKGEPAKAETEGGEGKGTGRPPNACAYPPVIRLSLD